MKKKLKECLTMKDFHIREYITWQEIEEVMGKRRFKKFKEWMFGQTCPMEIEDAVYPWDVENFLRPEGKRFFD